MADFRTHVTTSSVLGVVYCGVGYGVMGMPAPSCLLAGGLCGIAGMLPDLDSEPGVPLRESVGFAAATVPMLLANRLQHMGWASELIILSGAALYFGIRFGLYRMLQWYTVHRGMFHSIPAALIAGELGFLLCTGASDKVRLFKGVAVFLGYMSHLILDEFWSVQFKGGKWEVKKSFGSAIKLFDKSLWPNLSAYGKLAVLSYLCVQDPQWMRSLTSDAYDAPGLARAAEPTSARDKDWGIFSFLFRSEEGRAEDPGSRTGAASRQVARQSPGRAASRDDAYNRRTDSARYRNSRYDSDPFGDERHDNTRSANSRTYNSRSASDRYYNDRIYNNQNHNDRDDAERTYNDRSGRDSSFVNRGGGRSSGRARSADDDRYNDDGFSSARRPVTTRRPSGPSRDRDDSQDLYRRNDR